MGVIFTVSHANCCCSTKSFIVSFLNCMKTLYCGNIPVTIESTVNRGKRIYNQRKWTSASLGSPKKNQDLHPTFNICKWLQFDRLLHCKNWVLKSLLALFSCMLSHQLSLFHYRLVSALGWEFLLYEPFDLSIKFKSILEGIPPYIYHKKYCQTWRTDCIQIGNLNKTLTCRT